MIRITDGGLRITFANGWVCEVKALPRVSERAAANVEIAVWDPVSKAYVFADDPHARDGGHVLSQATADKLAEVLSLVAEQRA